MKKIGIVGGIGPVSTIDYYNGIVDGIRAIVKDGSYPEIIIDSVNMTEMLSYVANKDWNALVSMLLNSIMDLADAGAEFAAIASNTPHIVFDKIREHSLLPLISIVDATCKYAQSKGCERIVVTGTRFTMSSGLYAKALQEYGITAVMPSGDEQEFIHNIIFPNLEKGIVVPEDKQKMIETVRRLVSEYNAHALLLGCTELPLMIKDGDIDVIILNTTRIHIDAIVNCALVSRQG